MNPDELPSADVIEVTGTKGFEQKYSVIAELGHGGMSVVYLGTSRSLGNVQKLVVLKSIKPELLSNDKVRSMFMDEARLAIQLTHPNIVQTYEVAMIDRRPVLVMEYMEGQPLSSVLRKTSQTGGMPLAMKLNLLVGALNGLDHAHNLTSYDGRVLGLVHRDVSPQNIFITYEGHVKILDFGIAKALDRSAQTEFGEIKGKIRYMAPEQMQASADLDRRADVFAAGIMLWEFLANRRMWQDAKDVEVMKMILTQDIQSPREYAPDLHPRLEAICMKAIQREPNERYESCAAMQADLERVMEDLNLRSSERELGKLVQEQFADVRTSIRKAIDRKLKERDTAPINLRVDERGLLLDDELFTPRTQSMRDVSVTPSALGVTGSHPTKKSRWPYAAAALLLLGAAAWAFYPRASAEPQKPAVAANVPRPAAAAPAPAATPMVKVNLRSNPPDAKLFMDGTELPNNPFVRELPSDGSRHELSAEADGYGKKSTLLFLSGTEPIDVQISLEKQSKSKADKAGKAAAAARFTAGRKVAGPATAAPAAPDCAYPFYVDESGIRRVRKECM